MSGSNYMQAFELEIINNYWCFGQVVAYVSQSVTHMEV